MTTTQRRTLSLSLSLSLVMTMCPRSHDVINAPQVVSESPTATTTQPSPSRSFSPSPSHLPDDNDIAPLLTTRQRRPSAPSLSHPLPDNDVPMPSIRPSLVLSLSLITATTMLQCCFHTLTHRNDDDVLWLPQPHHDDDAMTLSLRSHPHPPSSSPDLNDNVTTLSLHPLPYPPSPSPLITTTTQRCH
ncbi:hypothetical protein OG21DRAFT_1491581 [Imleria badia]|nr:hypothetical protein OG21DRAFT_1491581 [Imleria badia]